MKSKKTKEEVMVMLKAGLDSRHVLLVFGLFSLASGFASVMNLVKVPVQSSQALWDMLLGVALLNAYDFANSVRRYLEVSGLLSEIEQKENVLKRTQAWAVGFALLVVLVGEAYRVFFAVP